MEKIKKSSIFSDALKTVYTKHERAIQKKRVRISIGFCVLFFLCPLFHLTTAGFSKQKKRAERRTHKYHGNRKVETMKELLYRMCSFGAR